jgi:hypothetical protein
LADRLAFRGHDVDDLIDDIYGNWTDRDDLPGMFDPDESHDMILAL